MSVSEINHLLRKINKYMARIAKQKLKQFGITVPQAMVVKEVMHEPKMISQLGETLGLTNSTVSGIVDRLEKQGWVKRERDLNDRRAVWIHKTDKTEEMKKQMLNIQVEMLSGMSQEEMETVLHALKTIHHYLEQKDEGSQ